MQELDTSIPTNGTKGGTEERYVCRRVVTRGVVVASLHPVIGPVYWDYCDESDCNAPDHYGLTDDSTSAHVFKSGWYFGHSFNSLPREIIECNVEHDYDAFGTPGEDDHRFEERTWVSWMFQELARKAHSTVDEFVAWVRKTQWVEFECPPRIRFLRNINGFVGYRPEWTYDIQEALTFDQSVLTSDDDLDVRMCGTCVPISKARDISAILSRPRQTSNHALEADVAYTRYRLNLQERGEHSPWVQYDEVAKAHAAAAGRHHALHQRGWSVSGHIAAFPDLLAAFEMGHALALFIAANPADSVEEQVETVV